MNTSVVLFFTLFALYLSVSASRPVPIVGTWSESKYGGELFICVDDTLNVWATYSEAGVLWGRANADKTEAKGTWYEAGDAACSSGTWEAYFKDAPTNNLLELKFRCAEDLENPAAVAVVRQERRKNTLANDNQCNVVYEPMTFVGNWGNKPISLNWLEACLDGNKAEFSMDYDERTVYVNGTSFEEGRIVKGRWYGQNRGTNAKTNGPYLFFPLSDKKAIHFFWSGSTILSSDLKKPENHRVEVPLAFHGTENSKCRRFNLNDGFITVNNAASLTAGLLFVATLFFLV